LTKTVGSGWYSSVLVLAILGLGVAILAGLIFKFYPTRKAHKFNLVKAIGRE